MDKEPLVQLLDLAEKLSRDGGGDPAEEIAAIMLITAAATLFMGRPDFLDAAHSVASAVFTDEGTGRRPRD